VKTALRIKDEGQISPNLITSMVHHNT